MNPKKRSVAESGRILVVNVEDERCIFQIELVICGDGSQEHDIHLEENVLYGSARLDCARPCYHKTYPSFFSLAQRDATAGSS